MSKLEVEIVLNITTDTFIALRQLYIKSCIDNTDRSIYRGFTVVYTAVHAKRVLAA